MRSAPLLHSILRTLLRTSDAKQGHMMGWRPLPIERGMPIERGALVKRNHLMKRIHLTVNVVVTANRQSCSLEI